MFTGRYNQTTMQSFMPPGTNFVTILRHPLSRFESAFLFEDFPAFLGIPASANPFQHFFEHFKKFKHNINSMYTLRNGMSFDLGLEPDDFEDTTAIRNFISSVENDFHLVLLMEYFDESLVMLKQHFCWTLEDVLYLKHNLRLRSSKKHHIPRQFRNKFLDWNKADVLLYEHFNQTFWRKVKSQYDNFWSEVRLLKQKSHAMAKECLLPGEHKDERRKNIATKLILNPRVGHDMEHLCRDLVKDEDGYLTYFRDIQLREQ